MDRTPSPSHRYNSPFVSCSVRSRTLSTPTRLGHRRYALANTFQTPQLTKQNRTWNSHISTRIDSNSPGYSSRVVQYNEEQEKSSTNLQSPHSRYDKLGVFPIVHFFKKELPVLKRKAEETSPLLNSSELSKYNTTEHNRMLLEKIIKTSPGNMSQDSPHKSDLSAKSVLDALKEISRKRIQSNGEEFVLNEDGKRMFVDHDNENNSRKRQRQNSHREDHLAPLAHRNKPIDEVMASRSSMEGYFPKKLKQSHTEKIATPKPTPVVKKIDVETQTIAAQQPVAPQPAPEPEVTKKEEKTAQETKPKKTSPVRVFDETPLVAMRRNRLIALMGSLNKSEAQKTTEAAKLEEPVSSKPLVSILSGSTKSPHKSPKHVTFNLPETENSVTSSESNPLTLTSPSLNYHTEQPSVTKTSISLVVPIVSATVVESKSPQKPQESTQIVPVPIKNDPAPATSSPVLSTGLMFGNPTLSSNPVSSGITFGTKPEQGNSVSVNVSKEKPVGFATPNSFTQPSGGNDNTKQAGFKFDLKNTPTTTAAAPATSLLPQFTASNSKGNPPPHFSSPSSLGQASLSFVGASSTNPPISFSAKSTTLGATTSTPSNFGGASLPSSFALPPTTTPANSFAPPSFTNKVSSPNFMSSTPTTKPPMFSFGQATTTVATNFTAPPVVSTVASLMVPNSATTATFTFATSTASAAPMSFGMQKSAVSTASPFNTQNNFASTTSSAPSVFPGADTKKTPTNAFFFASPNTFNKSAGDAPASGFGGDAKSLFTPAAAPSFNTTTTASFGSTSTLTSTASPFGGASATPSFGGNFGTSTNAPPFSLNANTNFGGSNFGTQKSGFGNLSDNKSGFTQSSGTSNPPSFFQSSFGATTTASSFNAGANTFSTTPAASFGSTETFGQVNNNTGTSAFNSPFDKQPSSSVIPFGGPNSSGAPNATPFGSTNSAAPNVAPFGGTNSVATANVAPFGGSNSSAAPNAAPFGATNSSAASNAAPFGATNSSATPNAAPFGGSNSVPAPNAAPFGGTNSSAAPNAAPFGGTNSSAAPNVAPFGGSNSSAAPNAAPFGGTNSSTAPPATPFGGSSSSTAPPNAAPFGSSNSSFGSGGFSANPQGSQGNVFTFGSSTGTKPGVFSFGNSEPPKPLFNFQNDNNTNAFGANSKGFGASSPPSTFGAMATPQFNVPPTGMFNIGAGGTSTPSRSRVPHKSKRRN